jgi:hypothetical protein
MALVSGIDDQRFLYLEKSGDSYHVVYHEFLGDGYRRAVHVAFVDGDRRVAFEREGGLGLYDIALRQSSSVPVDGEVVRLENDGSEGLLFRVTARADGTKRFTAVRYPGTLVMEAPFKSQNVFLTRRGENVLVGGDSTILSLKIGKM